MVAITVILAAVIGAFVLGIGGDQATAPQATWGTAQTVTPSPATGVASVTFEVTGVIGSQSDTDNLHVSAGGEEATLSTSEAMGVGDTISADLTGSGSFIPDGSNVRIVWRRVATSRS